MIKKSSFLILFITIGFFTASAQNADNVLGKWLSATGEGQVQIYKKGDKFYGKLSWLKFPNDASGKPKTDKHNPDEALQTRPELGIELLKDFTFNGEDVYDGGTIYDPKSGKTYSCKMTIKGDNLKIRGYIGISLLGRTENWTRVR